jgi:heme exporter protein D
LRERVCVPSPPSGARDDRTAAEHGQQTFTLSTISPPRHRSIVSLLTVAAVIGALVGLATSWTIWGAATTWPGFIGNFAATVIAFLVALAWDRRKRREEMQQEDDRERARDERKRDAQEKEAQDEQVRELERRRDEAIRRLSPVLSEIRRNLESLRDLKQATARTFSFPTLSAGAWTTNAMPLASLLADYGLISDLSNFYDELLDLRWLNQFRAQTHHTQDLSELASEVTSRATKLCAIAEDLEKRVLAQHEVPDLDRSAVFRRMGFNVVSSVAELPEVTRAVRNRP